MKAAETRRKDKVRWHSLPPASSMYRSVSAPSGDVEVTERVVVKAYGNVAPPHNLYPSSSGMTMMMPMPVPLPVVQSSSSSQVVPINNSNSHSSSHSNSNSNSSSSPGGGLPDSSGRDGGSARKRPGRKTRRPDGYGSSPDAFGNGFPTSLQFGDSREGGCKIQAEQMGKEAPLRGTNNYASLLSSPSPSSIPNPSFKTKLSFDAVSPKLPTAAAVSVINQPFMGSEGNTVQQVFSPPSPRQPEFLPHSSDVKYVEAAFSPLFASSMPLTTSTRFEVTSPESSSPTGPAYPMEDSTGNDSSEAEVSTPPATDFMTRFEAMYVDGSTFDTTLAQDVRSTASSNGLGSNSSSAVSISTSERPRCSNGHGTGRETNPSCAESRNRLESSSAIGIPKTKVKQAIIKSNKATNDYADPRRHGVPNMGPRQPAAEKGSRRSSPTVSSGVSVVHSQCAADPQSQWKPVSPVLAKESPVLNGEGLLECPHSWPGPGLSLLGSPIVPLGKPGTECVVNEQGGVGNGKSSGQSKIFIEHWSPQEVSQAMEAGQVFKATLRVNSHNRHEAYVTVDGVPLDILIDGLPAQNRAMEGDVVAVAIDPRSSWPRLKGSVNKQANPETVVLGDSGSRSECSKDGDGESGEEVFPKKCNPPQADTGRVQSECPERKTDDLGSNGWMSRVEEKVTEIRHQSFVQKDCNKIFSSVHEEAYLQKSKGSNHNNGRVADQRVAVTRSTVYQILKRPTPNEKTAAPALLQNGMEKGEHIKVPTAVGLGSLAAEDVLKGSNNVEISDTKVAAATVSLASLISTCPGKRPTAKVVAILEKSHRREAVVGFLEMPQQRAGNRPSGRGHQDESPQRRRSVVTMLLMPVDSRCPKMLVPPSGLPSDILQRVKDGDSSIATELVAARVDGWRVDSFLPTASVVKSLGQGGEIEPQLKAILFEHNAHAPDFPQASLDCLPKTPWKIPASEMKKRMDFRGHRIFSIDPPTARDLDDALSIERLWNGVLRVGVHIADVSYFINPGSALDMEAAQRSTSIYLEQRVLPMLPRLLCEELCSLNPGVDRLAFSVVWTISPSGEILEQWLGRSMIRSCAKLTYEHAQNMIDGVFLDMEGTEGRDGLSKSGTGLPEIHGNHSWSDIVTDVQALHELAKKQREIRIEGGALKLNNSKIVFSLDEDGTPYDSAMYKTRDSNFVVEEFMLLANMTVAKVISNAFPDSALLRRHPEPNLRKLKEFEEFCGKNDFELDTSSSGALRLSLEKMQDQVNHDPVLFNILMLFATKPMQLAKYFCTGELKDKEEWSHYALACPLYTHFTSPIRRYPDVLVHRMLAAALDAEEILSKYEASSNKRNKNCAVSLGRNQLPSQCFSSAKSGRGVSDAPGVQHALALAASKHRIPAGSDLVGIAAHCNERKLASRNVKEASDKLYLWAMLKKKGGLLSDARVLALGPKFMSLYICKIAMERRIYYEEIEGVNAEWFEATGTLVLDISSAKKTIPLRRPQGRSGRQPRTVADIAMVVNPADSLGSSPEQDSYDDIIREVEDRLAGKDFPYDSSTTYDIEELSTDAEVEPTVLPLTLRLFSAVPVSLHATGGDHRPLDIAVKLYVSSYAT